MYAVAAAGGGKRTELPWTDGGALGGVGRGSCRLWGGERCGWPTPTLDDAAAEDWRMLSMEGLFKDSFNDLFERNGGD